jgi:proline iminopeptidase
VPGERKVTPSDGVELYVEVAGRGPACLVVHGGPGQGTRSFEKMGADALEAFATMIYVDQRGSGSSALAKDYHLARVVEDFEEVRRAVGVDRVCLVAHSFGGILAVEYARRYPAHVSELIMANATLEFLGPGQQRMEIAFINQLLQSLGRAPVAMPAEETPATLAATSDAARAALFKTDQGFRLLTDHVETIKKMMEIDNYERARGFGNAVMNQRETYPEYWKDHAPASAEVQPPVLVLASAKDYAVGPHEHERFRFPRQQVVVLDTGHISYFDANAAFAGAIRTFLAEHARCAASPSRR